MKIAFCDLTHLFIDELQPIAEMFGIEKEYEEIAKGKTSFEMVEAYLKLIRGISPKELAREMEKAEPYEGAVEFINGIKEKGYFPIVVTDDPFLCFEEPAEVIRSKLGISTIYPTFYLDKNYKIKKYTPKNVICKRLCRIVKPQKVLGVVQGENDYVMAKFIKSYGGKVVGVNSDSEAIRSISDYWVPETKYLPQILPKI
jgi:phosphoglycolate phosphatase-like HAD superfamily hydrolase